MSPVRVDDAFQLAAHGRAAYLLGGETPSWRRKRAL